MLYVKLGNFLSTKGKWTIVAGVWESLLTGAMTQRWVRLDSRDDQLTHRSVERRYGELRHIKQRYMEGDDNWQVGGKSWHWQPVTPDVFYEYKEAGE